MTVTLTPSLTIRFRKAAGSAWRKVGTQTRRLTIHSLTMGRLEVQVFKYHAK